MTHDPGQGRPFRRRRPISLQWLLVGDDHRLARARYGAGESATERADRLEAAGDRARRARRQEQVRRAARKGQQWEDSIYTSSPSADQRAARSRYRAWARRLLRAGAPAQPAEALLAASTVNDARWPHSSCLPALPPGFAPATEDATPSPQAHASERSDWAVVPEGAPTGRPELAVSIVGTPYGGFRRRGLYLVGGTSTVPRTATPRHAAAGPAPTAAKAGGHR
ncbi:hypothetical protein [Streptomyces sp. NBC_00582]|uniref:hypothetical protein n=1 Tax=Streptomyces sp. NBC_00582 TaxID=2975783 RepID=UPI002E7FE24F|nr:hypothetical protein [Streptomyces sp. NBC_00582]WUB68578.1 hypothetical protein OG852_50665 [Streptomyces sp. NBC_00582]